MNLYFISLWKTENHLVSPDKNLGDKKNKMFIGKSHMFM